MSKKLVAVGLMSIMLAGAGCVTPAPRNPRTHNAHQPKIEDAAVARAPEEVPPKILPETYFAAAQLFEHQRLVGRALTQYRQAIAVNHNYVEAYHRLAVLLSKTGRHEEATQAFERAVQLRPHDPILHNDLGFEYSVQSRWSEAEQELLRAIELKPDFARAHVNLGMVLCNQERFEEGLAAFRTVLPEADAHYNLGLLLRGRHRYQDAARAFEHVLSLSPDFTSATVQLEQIAPQLALTTPLEPVANPSTREAAVVQATALTGVVLSEETPDEAGIEDRSDSSRVQSPTDWHEWQDGLRHQLAQTQDELRCWELTRFEGEETTKTVEAFERARIEVRLALEALAAEVEDEIRCWEALDPDSENADTEAFDDARNEALAELTALLAQIKHEVRRWETTAVEQETVVPDADEVSEVARISEATEVIEVSDFSELAEVSSISEFGEVTEVSAATEVGKASEVTEISEQADDVHLAGATVEADVSDAAFQQLFELVAYVQQEMRCWELVALERAELAETRSARAQTRPTAATRRTRQRPRLPLLAATEVEEPASLPAANAPTKPTSNVPPQSAPEGATDRRPAPDQAEIYRTIRGVPRQLEPLRN